MRRVWAGTLWVLSLGLATLAGAAWPGVRRPILPRSHGGRHQRTYERTRAVAPVFIPPGVAALIPPRLRRIIREELARQKAESDALAETGADLDRDSCRTTAADAGARGTKTEASSLVDRAVSGGTWTSQDRQLFSEATRGLPPAGASSSNARFI